MPDLGLGGADRTRNRTRDPVIPHSHAVSILSPRLLRRANQEASTGLPDPPEHPTTTGIAGGPADSHRAYPPTPSQSGAHTTPHTAGAGDRTRNQAAAPDPFLTGRARRGYFGIGIVAAKSPENVGGLWRSAHAFGAAFIFTVGARYPRRERTDTSHAVRHVPLFEHEDLTALAAAVPRDCALVGIECNQGAPRALATYRHPERAVYLLGAEDRGLSDEALAACDALIEIPSSRCLNVATAGAIVLYDRIAKEASRG